MKRAGFTMIELIFVIVILGILAAVAIPKLAATRTDAQVAKVSTEAATLVSELGTFYTAQGTFSGKDSDDITNITLKTANHNIANAGTIVLGDDQNKTCITVTFNNVDDGNITVAATSSSSSVCKGVASATKALQKTVSFGGTNVTW